MTINLKVKGEDIDWTHVFTSGDELAVPGLGIDVKGVAKAGLFVKVALESSEDDKLTLKVWIKCFKFSLLDGSIAGYFYESCRI